MSRHISSFFSRFLPWIIFTHSLLFIVFWLTNRLFYSSTNDYLADMLSKRLDYVSLLVWVSLFMAAWSCARGVLGLLSKEHRLYLLTSWIYGIISVVYLIFFYASFSLLFRESPVQLVRIGQLIGYFRLILDAFLLLGLALLAAFWLQSSMPRGKQAHKPAWRWGIGLVVVYLLLWSLPVIFPPGSVVRGHLDEKPLIIAHRGASMLAPENTIAAANLAVQFEVAGLETDIQVSRDGKLFLMHDDTLARTTDVATVFPGRQDDPAGNFTMDEIQQLNAGKWFVEQDPFGTIRQGLVSTQQVQEYRQQSVPLLADWLDIIERNHLVFIFDLKPPPADSPFAGTIFQLTLHQLSQTLNGSLVWFLVDSNQLRTLLQVSPEMVPAYGLDYQSPVPAKALAGEGYLVVNAEYGLSPQWIHQYEQNGLWVNLYTVDEAWQFSRLWILGANSITTSNARVMSGLSRPIFSLSWSQYLLVWGLVGVMGLGILITAMRYKKTL
ncbi:MAG TPA: glycerophosphodiester phosphodiesterase family protein [Anaerolineales bacterium]|nr:glycerophosphodiester phosphodiesterase family protein [Anaerolineales bacterium]